MGQPQPPHTNVASATTPRDIAQADIVLTTYDVLRQDLYRNPDREAGRSLRYEKRYDIIPTPLTGVRFWRVVVDEAQMVESSTAKATEMAMKIQSINRWCVTGTPISRGLEDLYGLFAFLRVEPYSAKSWWNMLIQNPLETGENYESALNRLINLLKPSIGGLMWRSSKSDVADELNLPEQIIYPTRLDFSKIERHFYSRQYEKCAGTARQVLQKSGITSLKEVLDVHGHDGNVQTTDGKNSQDRLLTKREERKLLLPLLRLRQACVHPQVGIGGLKSLSQVKTPMSMIEVLQVLINKAKVEAEDAQRLLLSSLNGLAGLKIIQSNYPEAASFYRRVLQLSQENDAMIKADKLQILHAMSNLGEIILKPGVGRTLQDETLEKAIENTQRTYMYESLERLRLMNNELEHIKGEERECLLNFSNGKSDMSGMFSKCSFLLYSSFALLLFSLIGIDYNKSTYVQI
jgi:E3 ubiquitin-protein ligase SHPRH